jgi:hypothetical protein
MGLESLLKAGVLSLGLVMAQPSFSNAQEVNTNTTEAVLTNQELNPFFIPKKDKTYQDLILEIYVTGATLSALGFEDYLIDHFKQNVGFELGGWNNVAVFDIQNINSISTGMGLLYSANNRANLKTQDLETNDLISLLEKYTPSTQKYLDNVSIQPLDLRVGNGVYFPDIKTIFYAPRNTYANLDAIIHELGHVADPNVESHAYNLDNNLSLAYSEFLAELFRKSVLFELYQNNEGLAKNVEFAGFLDRSSVNEPSYTAAFKISGNVKNEDSLNLFNSLIDKDSDVSRIYLNKLNEELKSTNDLNLIDSALNLENNLMLEVSNQNIGVEDLKLRFENATTNYLNLYR